MGHTSYSLSIVRIAVGYSAGEESLASSHLADVAEAEALESKRQKAAEERRRKEEQRAAAIEASGTFTACRCDLTVEEHVLAFVKKAVGSAMDCEFIPVAPTSKYFSPTSSLHLSHPAVPELARSRFHFAVTLLCALTANTAIPESEGRARQLQAQLSLHMKYISDVGDVLDADVVYGGCVDCDKAAEAAARQGRKRRKIE